MRILIMEDDQALGNEIYCIVRNGAWLLFVLFVLISLRGMQSSFRQNGSLDINLPYYDMPCQCEQIRKISLVPILFSSSRNSDQDKIMASTTGGDDDIQKPFALDYLMAKIQVILRRTHEYQNHVRISLGEDLFYDVTQAVLHKKNEVVELIKMENRILGILLKNKRTIVSRDALMMHIWSTNEFISDGSLITCISRLKRKIRNATGMEIMIITKKGQWVSDSMKGYI